MSPTHPVLLIAFSLSVFIISCAESRKFAKDVLPSPNGCTNCTLCPYPCHPLTPPSPPYGYPVYEGAAGAPPPQLTEYGTPPPPSSPFGYPAYGGPPSPLNCTPIPVQCCQYPPPYPSGYQPYNNCSVSCSPLAFLSLMLLILSITVSI